MHKYDCYIFKIRFLGGEPEFEVFCEDRMIDWFPVYGNEYRIGQLWCVL